MLDEPGLNPPVGTIYIDDIAVGMERSLVRTIGENEVSLFAEASSDRNPVHCDEGYARATVFEGRIVHGLLTASLISAVIGEQLPGHGAIYLKQSLRFLAPVRPGERVRASVKVLAVDAPRRRVTLECACRVGDTLVLDGEALVLAPSRSLD